MKTIKGKAFVCLTGTYTTLDDVLQKGADAPGMSGIAYYDSEDDLPNGWTPIGDAEITITFRDRGAITAKQIELLREQIQEVQSAAQIRVAHIETQIQNLLSLPYEAPTDPAERPEVLPFIVEAGSGA